MKIDLTNISTYTKNYLLFIIKFLRNSMEDDIIRQRFTEIIDVASSLVKRIKIQFLDETEFLEIHKEIEAYIKFNYEESQEVK